MIQRRNVLVGLAALGALGATMRWSGASLAPEDAVKTIVYKRLDYLSLDAPGVRQFAADYVAAMDISTAKLRLIAALAPLYRRLSSAPGHFLYRSARYGEAASCHTLHLRCKNRLFFFRCQTRSGSCATWAYMIRCGRAATRLPVRSWYPKRSRNPRDRVHNLELSAPLPEVKWVTLTFASASPGVYINLDHSIFAFKFIRLRRARWVCSWLKDGGSACRPGPISMLH